MTPALSPGTFARIGPLFCLFLLAAGLAQAGTQAAGETNENVHPAFAALAINSPDLVVPNFNSPGAAAPGGVVTVSDNTANNGAVSTLVGTSTKFYISTDAKLDPRADTLLGSRAVPVLGPGATSLFISSYTIPATMAPGSYYLIAHADGDNVVTEFNELNNARSNAITVARSDLIVSSLDAPLAAAPGSTFTVTDTTLNQGTGPTTVRTNTKFYLSANLALDPGDVLLGQRQVLVLGPGGTDAGSTSLTMPPGTAQGFYFIFAQADGDSSVTETNENNNSFRRLIRVTSADLVVSAPSGPAATAPGTTITVGETTTNTGSQSTFVGTSTKFYLSIDNIFNRTADRLLGSRAIPALGPGAANSATIPLTIPATTAPGNYFVIAVADGDNVIAEINEGNNTNSRAIRIGPDLVVSNLNGPAFAQPERSFSVTSTTTNQGGASTQVTTRTRFFLSTDANLDSADRFIGDRTVPSLSPGTSHAAATSVTIPRGTPAGNYYVIVQADGDNAVVEADESNNTSVSGSDVEVVYPDLFIFEVLTRIPTEAAVGSALVVRDETGSLAGSTLVGTTTKFYLSTDATFDTKNDRFLGSRPVPVLDGLSFQTALDTATTSHTIPLDVPAGNYFVIAQADADDVVLESNENNNTRSRFGPIMIFHSDVTVAALTAPAFARRGSTISVTDTTANLGPLSTGMITITKFYLSTDRVLDSGDTEFLNSRSIPVLAPGASSQGSISLTIPASTPPGNYFIIVDANGNFRIIEPRGNNDEAAPILILP